ncbi:unnamed protein product [Closterium sp. NIES-54]
MVAWKHGCCRKADSTNSLSTRSTAAADGDDAADDGDGEDSNEPPTGIPNTSTLSKHTNCFTPSSPTFSPSSSSPPPPSSSPLCSLPSSSPPSLPPPACWWQAVRGFRPVRWILRWEPATRAAGGRARVCGCSQSEERRMGGEV